MGARARQDKKRPAITRTSALRSDGVGSPPKLHGNAHVTPLPSSMSPVPCVFAASRSASLCPSVGSAFPEIAAVLEVMRSPW
ncbi:hypothetical protein E2562_034727 [Oryza meyeriana var. granulata]|uniref:Uncharacterized protein n=1 Tax=Oryza meyeriana var. granulata TaxID=110450 RepID=A0A6G1CAM3_9ORYZ|nr:hypothetical protein E2562_034727 [Oryza meyeriana var. granulata]